MHRFSRPTALIVALFMVFPGHALAQAFAVPPFWQDVYEGDVRVVSRGGMRILIGPIEAVASAGFERFARDRVRQVFGDARVLEYGEVTRDEEYGLITASHRIDETGKRLRTLVAVCPLSDSQARVVEMRTEGLAALNPSLLMPATQLVPAACSGPDAMAANPRELDGPDSGVVPGGQPRADSADAAATASRPAPVELPAGAPPDGLEALYGILTRGFGFNGMYTIKDDFLALFSDGSYTDNIAAVYAQGVETSRRENPDDWGRYRLTDDELLLTSHTGDTHDYSHWVMEPGDEDQRLEGCFGQISGSAALDTGDGAMAGSASSWCFTPDGEFTHDSATFISNAQAVYRGTEPSQHGRYRIDGYTLQLVYATGRSVRAAFAWLTDERSHILINDGRFMGRSQPH